VRGFAVEDRHGNRCRAKARKVKSAERRSDHGRIHRSPSLVRSHTLSARFSTNDSTWSNCVVNRFSAVKIPPFGPRLYLRRDAAYQRVHKWQRVSLGWDGRIATSPHRCVASTPRSLLHDLLVVHCIPDVDVG
jgi:hypothetical protein